MSQENVELVKALFAAGEMDKEALLAALPELIAQGCDPEIEWYEDPQRADARVYRGHSGVRESFERWLDQWDEYGMEAERFVDCGDDVLVVAHERGRGAISGATVSARNFYVLTIRNGKVLRYREFYDEAAALEAAGLSERAMSQENVETVKQAIAAVNARDIDGYLARCTEDIELRTPLGPIGGTYEGDEDIRRFFADIEDTSPDFRLDLEHVEAIGEDRVLAFLRTSASGRTSGIPTAYPTTNLYDFLDGKIRRVRIFLDRDEALEAAGLRE